VVPRKSPLVARGRAVRALHLPPTLLTRENEPIVACRAVLAVDDPDERASVVVQIQEQMERRWLDEPVFEPLRGRAREQIDHPQGAWQAPE
jgi:hypothetical protein